MAHPNAGLTKYGGGTLGEPTKGVSCGDREREDHGQQSLALGTVTEIYWARNYYLLWVA